VWFFRPQGLTVLFWSLTHTAIATSLPAAIMTKIILVALLVLAAAGQRRRRRRRHGDREQQWASSQWPRAPSSLRRTILASSIHGTCVHIQSCCVHLLSVSLRELTRRRGMSVVVVRAGLASATARPTATANHVLYTRSTVPTDWTQGHRASADSKVEFTIGLKQRNLDLLSKVSRGDSSVCVVWLVFLRCRDVCVLTLTLVGV
jgi:hypothetical protein